MLAVRATDFLIHCTQQSRIVSKYKNSLAIVALRWKGVFAIRERSLNNRTTDTATKRSNKSLFIGGLPVVPVGLIDLLVHIPSNTICS